MTYLARYQDNLIHDVQVDETGATEILTNTQLKAHLQITYTDDDTYLTDLIKACRAALEQFCCISMVSKTITVLADLYCERELPYGPVTSLTSASLKTNTGIYTAQTVNADYELDGITNGFQVFKPFISGRWKLIYTAGYAADKVPKDLILDLKRICGYCYEHKGDEALTSLQGGQQRPRGLDEALELFAAKHRRELWR
jgi:uncharacterized phiE125 gp8 family phage protein